MGDLLGIPGAVGFCCGPFASLCSRALRLAAGGLSFGVRGHCSAVLFCSPYGVGVYLPFYPSPPFLCSPLLSSLHCLFRLCLPSLQHALVKQPSCACQGPRHALERPLQDPIPGFPWGRPPVVSLRFHSLLTRSGLARFSSSFPERTDQLWSCRMRQVLPCACVLLRPFCFCLLPRGRAGGGRRDVGWWRPS